MQRRRWTPIVIAIAVVAVIEVFSDTILDELLGFPGDALLIIAVVTLFAAVGGWFAWRAIDRLTDALERGNREVQSRAATTRALHQVGLAIAGLADLGAVLRVVAERARSLLDSDVAVLVRYTADGPPVLAASSGGEDLILAEPAPTGDDASAFIAVSAGISKLAAPLRRGEATIGELVVASRQAQSYGVDDIETLAALANQASIAIENARLQDELREVAVHSERERIARELHDGLAQVLGYVNTKSQAVEELLIEDRTAEARVHLGELAAAARSVYVDVREAILGLSGPAIGERGLVAAMEQYARGFAEASKIAVHVDATAAMHGLELPPAIEAQALRIVQEALTNIRKHAAARRVEIDADVVNGAVHIEIRDDGRGFADHDPDADGWPRFGLTTMRERAATFGGTVTWESISGRGTTVALVVPSDASLAGAGSA